MDASHLRFASTLQLLVGAEEARVVSDVVEGALEDAAQRHVGLSPRVRRLEGRSVAWVEEGEADHACALGGAVEELGRDLEE